jgi:diguanylate cyclase (GGDEF)-like protein
LALGVLVAWLGATRIGQDQMQDRFEAIARDHLELVVARERPAMNVLHTLRGAFMNSGPLTREQFRSLVFDSQILERVPAVRALEFARTESVDLHVIEYLEPIATNEEALGLNLAFEPVRAEAIARALETGQVTSTAPLHLVQGDKGEGRAVLLMLALDHSVGSSEVPDEMRGLLVAVLDVALFLGAPSNAEVSVALHDGGVLSEPATRTRILHDTRWSDEKPATSFEESLVSELPLDFGGRRWILRYRAGPQFATAAERWLAPIAGVSSLIVGVVFLAMYVRLFRSVNTAQRLATELRASNVQVRAMADLDTLTSLANRHLFMERLDHALKRLDRTPGRVALLFLDLDGFKSVNDVHGHALGDQLLVEIAQRLRRVVREGDTVARLGGDEFTVLCEDVKSIEEVLALASRLRRAVREPIPAGGHVFNIGMSIGVSSTSDHAHGVSALLREADTAMYEAKRRGGSAVEVFDLEVKARLHDADRLKAEFRRAVEMEELEVVFQPIIQLDDDTVVGFEGLLRWTSAQRGRIEPSKFIPLAASFGLLDDLLDMVLSSTLAAVDSARALGAREPVFWVNLSCTQAQQPSLVTRVAAALERSSCQPKHLGLEIAGSSSADHFDEILSVLHELRRLGVQLALDDFGAGDSSFGILARLPVDAVKIDPAIVRALGEERGNALLEAALRLARAYGVDSVAKSVETTRQYNLLRELGCSKAQGHFFSPPLALWQLESAPLPLSQNWRRATAKAAQRGSAGY